MKYTVNNKPLVCMQTQSTCFKGTRTMEVKGVLFHSTGANNPNLKRYVQPSDNAADRGEWLARLGTNAYHNDWNHIDHQAGMNAWIGKLADGTVAAVQTMPWDYRPWGCGSGGNGSCNNGWIQFEICEDGLNDAAYFAKVYREAVELMAYLCKLYHIDPNGTAQCGGVTAPTILCHADSHRLGLGSNHGDVLNWFPKFGKSMATVRSDVLALLASSDPETPAQTQPAEAVSAADSEKTIWDALFVKIGNVFGVAGLMGNLYAESALKPENLQNTGNKKLGMTDEEYTAAVDSGAYSEDAFIHDGFGYGLAQWTYYSRKAALLAYARNRSCSIGDLETQLGFLLQEIRGYKAVWDTLTSASSVRAASDAVLLKYERPVDQSEAVQKKRTAYGKGYYDKYAGTAPAPAQEPESKTGCSAAQVIAVAVGEIGYKEKASNKSLDDKTANAGSGNYTKYARDFDQKYPNWYNGKKNGYAWCDMFVDWCFLTAFGYEKALKLLCQPEKSAGAGCTYSLSYFKNKGQFHTSGPRPGDQIFFGTSLDNSSHTGIVEKVEGSTVHTIEGNTSDQVARRSYALSNSRILGYGRPDYDAAGSTAPAPQPEPEKAAVPFLVKVSISDLNIRSGPGTDNRVVQTCPPGVYTIVAVSGGAGSSAGWGKLKSGVGWISLDFCSKKS